MTMKTNYWLILGTMLAAGAVAQTNTNTALPAIPAPATAPAVEPAAPAVTPVAVEPVKKVAPAKPKKIKRVALKEPTVALLPGVAEVAATHLNVRGQAGLKGEVVGRLNPGDSVTVLAQINLDKHEVGEPAQWAKIALPSSTHVWVHTPFIDAATKTVVPKKLNLRAGPGENFSVLGVIEHGVTVKEITSKDGWTQIEPPQTAYAFVAAMYLKQAASGTTVAANVPPSTETEPVPAVAPTPTPVADAQPIVTEPTNNAANAAAILAAENAAAAAAAANALALSNSATTVDTNPPPPRVVTHEGVVGHVGSIIAPTAYVLYDPATHQEINYLYTTSTNLDISRYYGMRIVVTGEEGLAKRWNETPVLTIQRIVVLNTNEFHYGSRPLDYRIPRQVN